MKKLSLLILIFLLSCGKKDVTYNYPDNPDYFRKSRAGHAFSKSDLVVYGKKKDKEKLEEKAEKMQDSNLAKSPLWQASVEVIGALFPIAILNPESGIITTEWYQDTPTSAERIKINAIIKGPQATQQNLQLTIFRQKKSISKNSSENWQDLSRENSDSNSLSIKLLQEKILSKAQQK